MTLVVLHGDAHPVELGELNGFGEVRRTTARDLAAAMPGADALLLWDFFSTAVEEVWEHADALRWIHVAAAGVDRLLFPALVDSEVVVTNSRGVFDRPIAEFVLASMLGMAKDLPGSLRRQQSATWEHRETEQLEGARTLIVGTGSIGRACARLLAAVGVTVAGVGRTARTGDPDFGTVHEAGRLGEVVGEADYVVLIAPLTAETRGMIDAEVLAAMRPSARLINVGRGELVVESALVRALATGGIAGAALDVFNVEPLAPTSPLWSMENVLISAHMSGDTVGWRTRLAALFHDNAARYLAGDPLRNVVDKRLGFVSAA